MTYNVLSGTLNPTQSLYIEATQKNDAVTYTPEYQVVEHSTESCLSASHLAPSVRQYWCQAVRPITRKHHLNTAYSARHLLTTTPNYISTWLFMTSESFHEGILQEYCICIFHFFGKFSTILNSLGMGSNAEWQWTFHFSPKLKAAPKAALDPWPKMNQDFFAETLSTTTVSWSRCNSENAAQGYCLHSILSITS